MTAPLAIIVNAVNRTQVIPFKADGADHQSSITIDVIAPGIATMRCTVWDQSNTVVFNENDPILVTDPSTPTHNAFQGYVIRRRLTPQANFRLWDLECVDLNSWLDVKLVGVPDGTSFLQDPPGTYTAFDPAAVTLASDKSTIAHLFSFYASDLPVDVTTYVSSYAPNLPAGAIRWNTVTLRQALEDLAAYVNPAIRFWIDADWAFHWTLRPSPTIPVAGSAIGPVLRLLPNPIPPAPAAPRALTDGASDGITTFPYDSFTIEYDDQGWADSIYVNGQTGFTYDPAHNTTLTGGSGWALGIAQLGRQRLLNITNSDTKAARDNFGGAALTQASHAVVRGSATVTCDFGGWFPGQAINITNSQAGLSASQYLIQRTSTTFLSGLGERTIALDWGDAPPGTIGLRRGAQRPPSTTARRPAVKMIITVSNASPGAGGVVRVYGQAADQAGNPWPVVGKTAEWTVQVFDVNCVDVTASTNWSLSASASVTNIHGMAWTDLTTSTTSGLTYYVTALCTV